MDDLPEWTVTVDPLTTALGFVHVQVERRTSDHTSVYLGPSLHLFPGLLGEPGYLGYGAEAGFRWFPWGGAPKGGWLMVRGVGAALHTTDEPHERALGGYGSVLGGYTGIIGGRWVLAGGAGVQYLHYSVGGLGPIGVAPALHTNLGVAF